ncbi:unnamed protein product [Symbiodinium sp. CCMP2592]|nr:unnamed protein product [Symbiodinium sp. CCMP2592]CAE7729900.1 unnamed protein product [Symbiodinium sp. CCMP2592]CAE7836888.1 unnamed protein product [Symbiodinium sp. CCMP2592]
MGLSCPMPMDEIEVGGDRYPCFRVESYLRVFSLHNKLSLLLGHVDDFSLVEEYWKRYKAIDPEHPTFSYHDGREKFVIPCYIHSDEGRTLKKSSIMVCNLQPVLGSNPDPDYDSSELHTNMKFTTWATRLLLFVMLKQAYKKNDRPLYAAWESVAAELVRLFEEGCTLVVRNVRITIYVCVVAAKGDWPLLAKLGRLARFFGRKSSAANAQGICHLCYAGRPSHPYHDYTETATWRATYLQHQPHKPTFVPPFSVLPQHSALWYRAWFKGADTAAVCRWLETVYANRIAEQQNPSAYLIAIHGALRVSNQLMHMLYRHGLFVSRANGNVIVSTGYQFLNLYFTAAYEALQQRKTRFKLTPKYHALTEIIDYVRRELMVTPHASWVINPVTYSCQSDEDFVGKVSALSTAVARRSCHTQVLARYAIQLWQHWDS